MYKSRCGHFLERFVRKSVENGSFRVSTQKKCLLNTLTSDRKFPKKTRIKRNKISFEAISGNEDIFRFKMKTIRVMATIKSATNISGVMATSVRFYHCDACAVWVKIFSTLDIICLPYVYRLRLFM